MVKIVGTMPVEHLVLSHCKESRGKSRVMDCSGMKTILSERFTVTCKAS